MRWSGFSQIGDGGERQSAALRGPTAIILFAISLGGCAGLGMPFGEAQSMAQVETTGSIHLASARTTGGNTVDQSDWEAVRQAITATAESRVGSSDWQNPRTGSTGTVSLFDTVTAINDPRCRNFATTVNDMRGIRRYRGEACHLENGKWQLFGILADDSQLL